MGGFEGRPGASSLVEETFERPNTAGTPGKQTLTAQLERGHDHDHDHEPMEANDKVGAKVFKSPRFMGDPTLEKVAAGTTTLKKGASGLAVSRIQSALADTGQAVARSGTATTRRSSARPTRPAATRCGKARPST